MRYSEVARRSWALLRPHARSMALVVVVTITAAAAAGGVDPLFQKHLIDVLAEQRFGAFAGVAAAMVVFYTLLRGLGYLVAVATQRLTHAVTERVVMETVEDFYGVAYPEVAARDRGYFTARLYEEPAKLVPEMISLAVGLLSAVATFVAAAAVCLWLSWKLAIALSVVVPLVLWLARRFGARISEAARSASEREAALRDTLGRAVASYKTVNLFGLSVGVLGRVRGMLSGYHDDVLRRTRYTASYQTLSSTLLSYAELAVLLGAGWMVLRGDLTIGGLFGFMGAYWSVVRSFEAISRLLPAAARVQAAFVRLDEMAALPRAAVGASAKLGVRSGVLRFGDRAVLDGVDLSVGAGERVLVTGPNGCGKSTLGHVLAGLQPLQGGEQDTPVRSRVSALLLPFAFIPGTLLDNVGFPELDEERRSEFRRLAGRFGLDRLVEQDPATLSQGEQRKFQVLMTLLRPADYYLLDEPLSNVDEASKDVVMCEILERTRGRGLVVIMHGDGRFHPEFDRHLALEPAPELLAAA
jgi:ABC-type multidrug transport system fused ATPase/permease subunit